MTPKDPPKPPNSPPPVDADYAVPSGIDVYHPDYVPPKPGPEVTDPAAAEGFAQPSNAAPPATAATSPVATPEPTGYSASESAPLADSPAHSATGYSGGPTSSDDPARPFAPGEYSQPAISGDDTSQPAAGEYAAQPLAPSGMSYSAGMPVSSDDAPLLPPELAAEGALQHAVGPASARARKRAARGSDDGDGDGESLDGNPKRSRRTMIVASLAIVVGIGSAALVFLGRANAQRYVIACDASNAYAQQGRSFPPWGVRAMTGAEWAPIALPANAECQTRETEKLGELTTWYLEILLDRATTTLTAKDLLDAPAVAADGKPAVAPLDSVSAQLDHALLLARDPDRRDQRKEITRLQGDVAYWRAALRLRDASAILLDASKQFDAANAQHPRHATDAAAWSTFLHHLSDELRAGPNGAPIAPSPPSGPGVAASQAEPPSQPAPVGAALPVEPDSGSGDGSAGNAAATPSSVPAGGVLL